MRSHSKYTLAIAGLLILAPIKSALAEVYVICNSGLDMTEAQIKEVFSGEQQTISGNKLAVVDNKAAEDEFFGKVVEMTKTKYYGIWSKKAFREGIQVPNELGSDADVVSFVKSNPGGVGYVASSPAGVKVVKKY